jgi:rare lipoprotein A
LRRAAALLLAALLAAACGSAPKKGAYYADDGPPESVPDGLDQVPDAVPRDEAFNRFANRPYTVFGMTYVPVVDREPFRQRGLASWYGRKFQGQKTASGEPYDMFKMTAAHKTLPIPSYAKVTNLANGKSVVVRINDRGPFHSNRIIDLSYAAAVRIGIAAKGSGMVEVERVFEPGKEGEPEARPAAMPAPDASAAAPQPVFPDVRTPVVAQERGEIWVQLGAFGSAQAAESFRERATRELSWNLEPIRVVTGEGLNRVRLGPYRNREEAEAIAAKVRESLGYVPSIIQR